LLKASLGHAAAPGACGIQAGARLGRLPKFSTPVEKTVEIPAFPTWSGCFNPEILGFLGSRSLETRTQPGFSPIVNVIIA
jgi:hypothetical protein